MTVKPVAFDHKSKMRIIEHGEDWSIVDAAVEKHGLLLLQSNATGYMKWWPTSHIKGLVNDD